MAVRNLIKALVIACIAVIIALPSFAQYKKRVHRNHKADSSMNEINSRLSDSILQEAAIKDTTVPNMVNKIESYSFILNRAEAFQSRNLDTGGILGALSGLEHGLNYFKNRLQQSDNPLNLRNLNTASVLLGESAERLSGWTTQLGGYGIEMDNNLNSIRKIKHDTTLINPALDSVLRGQLTTVHDKAVALDSIQHVSLIKIKTLRNRVSINYLLVQDLTAEIHDRTQSLRANMLKQEEPGLFSVCPGDYDTNFSELIVDAIGRSYRVLMLFMLTTWDNRSINMLIWLVLLVWFWINLRRIKKEKDVDSVFSNVIFLKRSAFLSSLFLLFTFGPFLYAKAPMAYLHVNELCRLILLTVLLVPFLSKPARWCWLLISVLWIYFAIDDLLLDAAFLERWALLIAALLLTIVCVFLYRKKSGIFVGLDHSPATRLVLIITILLSALSIIFNITGRFTLAKLFGIGAAQGIVLAVAFKIFSAILIDAVYIQSEAFKTSRFSAFLDFIDLKNKLRQILWVIAVVAWIFALLRNLTFYDPFYFVLDFFFSKKREIGSISFTYSSLVLFALILWISSILSRFVNFFFDQNRESITKKRTRLGSLTLILRIGIWAAGFLIAIGAAGIPLDKISILIGALGVGIGFGLQNLVNNLVSGIILAFERPIQIGDLIEIGGRTGVVQEIGVRSSKMDNGEGANIIVPNGDMLSQQLINWTLNSRNRRSHLMISVPYKSDFKKAKELIEAVVKANDKIMKDPAPQVSVSTFTNNAINFEIAFWSPDLSDTQSLSDEILLDIAESFSGNGIVMG